MKRPTSKQYRVIRTYEFILDADQDPEEYWRTLTDESNFLEDEHICLIAET